MANVHSLTEQSSGSSIDHGDISGNQLGNVIELKKQRSLLPEKWGNHVRTVEISEHQDVGLSIAQAFATDELAHYLLDSDDMIGLSDEVKWRIHVDMMRYTVAAHCISGLVTTIGPDYEGVALW